MWNAGRASASGGTKMASRIKRTQRGLRRVSIKEEKALCCVGFNRPRGIRARSSRGRKEKVPVSFSLRKESGGVCAVARPKREERAPGGRSALQRGKGFVIKSENIVRSFWQNVC